MLQGRDSLTGEFWSCVYVTLDFRYERLKDLVREEEQRKEAANKKKIEELEKEADETKCQLRYLESHGEEFAAKATSYDDIDWAKISSRTVGSFHISA